MEPVAKDDNSDVGRGYVPAPSNVVMENHPVVDVATGELDPEVPSGEHPVPVGAPPLADQPEYYSGLWNGIPLFQCPWCSYTALSTHGGSGAIELHVLTQIDRGNKAHAAALELKGE